MLTDGRPNDVDHYEGRFGIVRRIANLPSALPAIYRSLLRQTA